MKKVGAPVGRPSIGGASAQGISVATYAADDLAVCSYQVPPEAEVSVREFEDYTRDRLKVLHAFDRLCSYDAKLDSIPEMRNKVRKELNDAQLLLEYPSGLDVESFPRRKEQFRTRDAISHFALRLAFCKTKDARDWFLKQEQRLFVLRFDALKPEAKEAYVAASGVKCKKIDMMARQGDGKVNLHQILHSTPGAKVFAGDGKVPEYDPNFYEMPFTEVTPNLIAQRRVVIMRGTAYVPASALKLILAKRFRDALSESLDVAFQGLPIALSDPRIGGFLRDLQDHGMQLLVAPKSSSDELAEKLALENCEEMLPRSFPPCMRRLVEQQRERKKHLKHAGRLQLRPFLKECGFDFVESIQWWKTELCKDPEIDPTSYEKNYMYDVEHAYGKKGNFQGQHCFGCPKVIGFPSESAGQVHGCPFKGMDTQALKQQLHRWKVPEEAVNEMDKLIANGKHYQLACIEYFKAKHPGHTGDGVGNSPGDFFRESCRHFIKKKEKEMAAAGGTPSPVKA